MYIINQKVTLKEGHTDAFINNLTNRKVLAEQAGFIDLTVMRHEDETNTVGLIGRWEDKASWAAWENTDKRQDLSNEEEVEVIEMVTDKYESIGEVKK